MVVDMQIIRIRGSHAIMFIEETRIQKPNIHRAYQVTTHYPQPPEVGDLLTYNEVKALYDSIRYTPWRSKMYAWMVELYNHDVKLRKQFMDEVDKAIPGG